MEGANSSNSRGYESTFLARGLQIEFNMRHGKKMSGKEGYFREKE
jgi:hypothetical protein